MQILPYVLSQIMIQHSLMYTIVDLHSATIQFYHVPHAGVMKHPSALRMLRPGSDTIILRIVLVCFFFKEPLPALSSTASLRKARDLTDCTAATLPLLKTFSYARQDNVVHTFAESYLLASLQSSSNQVQRGEGRLLSVSKLALLICFSAVKELRRR
jgi:hypothetical protein